MKKTPRDNLDLYRKLLALASDAGAATGERQNAIRKLRALEDEDPGIRLRWARAMADEEVKARAEQPPPPQPPPAGPRPHVRPLDTAWADFLDRSASQWGGLFERAKGELGGKIESWASATAEDLTGAALLSFDSYLKDLEAFVSDLFNDSDPFDTWNIDGKKPRKLIEAHLAIDEDECMIDEDGDEGLVVQLAIQIPVGLLAALAGDPEASQALVAELLEITGDLLEGDEDDDED